ncbi:MAG: UTP--glucose-1-phosphate uridylyltransferase, partial [Clostridia bacterium]|nr:UTP--glucose-1-phosphate uridylyltransferase [Clostridia bacterium]
AVLENLDKSKKTIGSITPINAVTIDDIKRRRLQLENVGFNSLREGKVAAVLLAGGQGSRLGYEGPKGTFEMGLTRKLSIFELQIESLKYVAEKAGRHPHLFIMTSVQNDAETQKFFEENNFFGYPHELIHFFIQDVAPTCDFDGKVFLDQKYRVSLAPNGNGGWYSSLINGGFARLIERENIEWLNVDGVDNVLQKPCDPAFIGATILNNCRCGAKVVSKVSPEEKVGVICNEDGKPTVLEYFEIPESLKNKTENGKLVYRFGVILNYLFSVKALNQTLPGKLPYHLAEKAITHIEYGERVTPPKPCGYKLETLVVDMVKLKPVSQLTHERKCIHSRLRRPIGVKLKVQIFRICFLHQQLICRFPFRY